MQVQRQLFHAIQVGRSLFFRLNGEEALHVFGQIGILVIEVVSGAFLVRQLTGQRVYLYFLYLALRLELVYLLRLRVKFPPERDVVVLVLLSLLETLA